MISNKVLIVEDNEVEADALEVLISSLKKNFKISKTGFAEEAFNIAKKEKVVLFIIDLQLKDYSGMDLANKIRKLDTHKMTPIVFITGDFSRELFAFKTYHCYDYIIKPYNKEQVSEVLQTILLNDKEEDVFRYKLKSYIYSIKQSDILYVESLNRKVRVYTTNGAHPIKGKSMSKIEEELGSHFLRVHASFIVNFNKIIKTNYSTREIFIVGIDNPIPIGKSKLSMVKEKLNDIS